MADSHESGAGGSRDRGIQRSSSLIPLKKHRLFERYSLLSTTLRESYALWAHKLHLLEAFSTLREVDIQNEGEGNANVKGPHLQVTRCARARPLVSNKLQSARAGLHSYSRLKEAFESTYMHKRKPSVIYRYHYRCRTICHDNNQLVRFIVTEISTAVQIFEILVSHLCRGLAHRSIRPHLGCLSQPQLLRRTLRLVASTR
ncbi:hypothetical protein V8E55_005335 [Tylopilus felleus]